MEDQICTLFIEIVDILSVYYKTPVPQKILILGDFEKGWCVELNPTNEKLKEIQPFTALVSWNGFPGGLIDPSGSYMVNGSIANEDTFREWLSSKRTKK